VKPRFRRRGMWSVAVLAVVLVCLAGAIGYLAATHEWRAMGATASDGPPPNDDFADVEALGDDAGSTRGTNVRASLEHGEPVHYPFAGRLARSSVWFKWTPPSTGWATFETCGSGFDSVLAVYMGVETSALRQLVRVTDDRKLGDEDRCEPASRVRFKTAARTLYYIAVAGNWDRGRAMRTGDFTLTWSRDAPKLSCFFSREGATRWCLGVNYGYTWTPCWSADVHRDSPRRYSVWDSDGGLGYARRARPGRWRAIGAAGRPARGGTITRAKGGRWIVRNLRGRSLGFARGPYPVAVGAYRLLRGDCQSPTGP
jgi:hypothetical protein